MTDMYERLLRHACIERNSERNQRDDALEQHRYVDAQMHHALAEEHESYFRLITNLRLMESSIAVAGSSDIEGAQ